MSACCSEFPMCDHSSCVGCQRYALNPRNTLRFREYDDDGMQSWHWAHVDPSGNVYQCSDQTREEE